MLSIIRAYGFAGLRIRFWRIGIATALKSRHRPILAHLVPMRRCNLSCQTLEWFARLDSDVVCALLERWPSLEELRKTQPASLRAFLRKHRGRDREQIEHRMEAIRQAIPAIHDRAVIEAKSAAVRVIVRVVRVLGEGIEDLDGEIEEATAAHPDFFIFNSLPGAGPVMAPRLLAAFGSQRERYRSADELQSFSGIAPLTETSGKRKWVHFRWACPKFLRQNFHEWAGHSIAQSEWARAYYQQQRSKASSTRGSLSWRAGSSASEVMGLLLTRSSS